jgi:hypothetical protein
MMLRAAITCLLSLLAGSIVAAAPFPDSHSLALELHRIAEIEAEGRGSQIEAGLPPAWDVDARGHHYSIPTAPLRPLLQSPDRAIIWLDHLAQQLESFSSAPAPPDAGAELTRILSRREFAAARPPGPLELLLQRIGTWLQDLLRRLFAWTKQSPFGGEIVFWLTGLAAIALLAVWLFRFWTAKSSLPPLARDLAPAVLTWQQWVSLAQQAIAQNDSRRAIQCVYWAAVVHLQTLRVLPEDLTRTPREYLGMLPDHAAARASLAALTSSLERFWYAQRPITPADLRDSFSHLEALGCQLN